MELCVKKSRTKLIDTLFSQGKFIDWVQEDNCLGSESTGCSLETNVYDPKLPSFKHIPVIFESLSS
jgi:hypothetical protein